MKHLHYQNNGCTSMKKMGEKIKTIFSNRTRTPTTETYLLASTLTLTSLRSELLHSTNLETCEPRRYFANSKFISFGTTTYYKAGDM